MRYVISINFKKMLSQVRLQTEFLRGSLQGYVNADYKTLIKLFGEPDEGCDGYKTDAQWLIFTPYGSSCIYNYKDGKNYLGEKGAPVEKIREWHIGGNDKNTVPFIQSVVEAYESQK